MLVKIILLFLAVMALLGMVGKLLFPSSRGKFGRRKDKYCADCGRPQIGKACDCKGKA